jgi:hypothetical protein
MKNSLKKQMNQILKIDTKVKKKKIQIMKEEKSRRLLIKKDARSE